MDTSKVWNGSNGSLTATQATADVLTINSPIAGTIYTLNLTTIGSCTVQNIYQLTTTSISINAAGSSSTCAGGSGGSGTVFVSGSGTGYSYNWFNTTNTSVATTSLATGLSGGVYSISISSAGSQSATCGSAVSTITVSSAPVGLMSILKPYCGSEAYLCAPSGTNIQWYNGTTAITPSLGGSLACYTVSSPSSGSIFRLTLLNTQGCRDSIEYSLISTLPGLITVLPIQMICPGTTNVLAVITISPSPGAPYGTNFFSVSATGTTATYTSTSGGATNFAATNLSAGGTYSVEASDGVCKYSQTFTVPINVFDYTLLPAANPTICPGNSVFASVSFTFPPSTGLYAYSWSPTSNLLGSAAQNAIITPVTPSGSVITTIYTVVVTSSVANCSLTKTLAITSANLLTPTISPVPLLCQNQISYTPSASPGGGVFVGNGSNISNGQIIPAGSSIGSNTFSYSISSGTCVTKASSTCTVNTPPVLSISGNTLLCEGQSTSLLASGATTYSWNSSNTGPVISVTPAATSIYIVEGNNAITTCSNTKTITVTVVPHTTLTILGDTLLCPGESSSLTVNGASSYLWSNGSNSQSIFVLPTSTTIYTVSGTSALASCSGPEAITVKVSSCNFVGLKELNLSEILSVYPNPTNEKITIESEDDVTFTLHDAMGRQLSEEKIMKKNHFIDLANYPNGIYFLKLNNVRSSTTIKLIKTD